MKLRSLVFAVCAVLSVAGCVSPLDGNTSCRDFLKANLADREDIVDEAMNQHGQEHDQMYDLTIASMQVEHACGNAKDKGVPVKDVIAWDN